MKKIAFLFALIILSAYALQAQTTSRWGITGGINYNQIHFKQSDIMDVDRGWGPLLGVTGEMNFSGIGFGVDASALYSMRSGKLHYGDKYVWSSDGYGDESCRMHYLDVPLHVKFKYHNLGGTEATIMPLVYVGPQFSFLMGKNLRKANDYKTVSVYLDMGIGFELFERVQVRGGYCFSIGQTLHTVKLDDNVAKNRCWNFSVTYFLK